MVPPRTTLAQEMHLEGVASVQRTEATSGRAETQSRCPGALGPETCSPVDQHRRVAPPTTTSLGKRGTLQERADCTRSRVCKSCRASKSETIGLSVGLWPGASVQTWEKSSDEDNGSIGGNHSARRRRDRSRRGPAGETRRPTREGRKTNVRTQRRAGRAGRRGAGGGRAGGGGRGEREGGAGG